MIPPGLRSALTVLLLILTSATTAPGETLRVASYHVELTRDGPGLLLRDLISGQDAQIAAVVRVITRTRPDILALQGIDWDRDGVALSALAGLLREAGLDYPYQFTARPNSGLETGLDMDGNGRLGEAADSQGYGAFTGKGGMAVLSRLPILRDEVQDFSDLLWANLPGNLYPTTRTGAPFPSPEVKAIQRLSTTNHWAVPIRLPDGGRLTLLTYLAGPPVFDGPEDRNGRRNFDETRFWRLYLDGIFGPAPWGRFVIAGSATLDPFDGDGRSAAIRDLLADPRLQDPRPTSPGGADAPDQGHRGANALDTVDWPVPGRLRVDYVLPSADWQVAGAGVYWPEAGEGRDDALSASRHRLVWVDLVVTPAP